MNKVLAVIRREFIERVRTRAFIIGTLIVPGISFGFAYLSRAFLERDTRPRSMVLVDAAGGGAGDSVEAALGRLKIGKADAQLPRYLLQRVKTSAVEPVRDSLIRLVGVKSAEGTALDGVLVLTDSGVEGGRIGYYGTNVASFSDIRAMERTLGPVLRQERMARRGADSGMIAAATVNLDLETHKVTNGRLTGESGESSFWLAYITSFVMYFSLIMYGVQVMGAVLEEKSNRIVEVLVSSLSPFELLLGKVVGVAGAGLLQLGIWGAAGAYLSRALTASRASGADQLAVDGARQSFSAPTVTVELIIVVLVFFFLGFLLYSSLYAAVGAMCSSQQETQQAAQPVTIILAVGFIAMFSLINDPSSSLARTLSFIPFFSPLVIPVRYALSPLPLGEVLGAVAATLVGMLAVVWLAGRIYRVGILSYGKKPTFKELWGWVRTA